MYNTNNTHMNPLQWTVSGGLSVPPSRNYICYRWMEIAPDLELLSIIGSVYNMQVLYGSMYAHDSLRCFYAVHALLCNNTETMDCAENTTTTTMCGCKRAWGGCLLCANKRRAE